MVREKYAVLASGGSGRFPKLLAGFESPSGRIWFWGLMVWLVVPDRYCDPDRSTRRRFAAHSVPSPVSEGLEGDIGLADREFDFASQSLTCLSTANLCVPVKVLTFIAPPQKEAPVWYRG